MESTLLTSLGFEQKKQFKYYQYLNCFFCAKPNDVRSFLSLVVGGLASLFTVLALVYLLLPNEYNITASVELDKAPSRVFPLINNLENWSYWAHKDLQGYEQNFFGAKSGEGAVYEWRKGSHHGRIEIVRSKKDTEVVYKAYLPNGITAQHIFSISPSPTGAKLIWRETGSYGWDPRVRAYAWLTGLEAKLSQQYQKTLNSLLQ